MNHSHVIVVSFEHFFLCNHSKSVSHIMLDSGNRSVNSSYVRLVSFEHFYAYVALSSLSTIFLLRIHS
jgi:hypothetical protein